MKHSQCLRSTLSHAFCLLIAAMDDISVHVSQKATVYLGTIHDRAIQSLLYCLECQFASVPEDRPAILKTLYQLFNVLIERKILNWEFFASQFETVIANIQGQPQLLQHQLVVPHAVQPPTNGSGNSDHHHHHHANHPEARLEKTRVKSSGMDSVRSLVQSQKYPYKRTFSAPAGIALSVKPPGGPLAPAIMAAAALNSNIIKLGDEGDKKHYKRQQSAPNMRHKVSKVGSEPGGGTAAGAGGGTSSITRLVSQSGTVSEDIDVKDVAVRSIDLDTVDKETLHLLVFLFMQFLSHPNHARLPENKNSTQHTAMLKSFQCLFSLIGFDDREHRFTTMPHKVRATAQFYSFFANLPQVMDNNFGIGNYLMANIVLILQKSPFPPRYAANWQPTYSLLQENLVYQVII